MTGVGHKITPISDLVETSVHEENDNPIQVVSIIGGVKLVKENRLPCQIFQRNRMASEDCLRCNLGRLLLISAKAQWKELRIGGTLFRARVTVKCIVPLPSLLRPVLDSHL